MLAGKKVVTKDADGNVASEERHGAIPALPNVVETWESSKPYIVEPFAKRRDRAVTFLGSDIAVGVFRHDFLSGEDMPADDDDYCAEDGKNQPVEFE